MTLRKCKDCGNSISPKAEACPFCGAPLKRKLGKTRIGCFGSMIIIVLIVVAINYISGINDKRAEEEGARKRARIEEEAARKMAEIQKRKKQEQENLQRENIEYYKANKTKIISQIKTYFSKGEYENALTVANKYISAEDPDLKRLRSNVLKIIQAKRKLKREQEILAQLKTIPVSEYKRNLDLYRELEGIDPKNQLYKKKITFYELKYRQEKQRASCDLELLSWHWSTTESGNYVTAEGEVKNISGRKLKRVQAVVTWYDSVGRLITSDASTIQYSPLMPGQTSPFKVMERYNPAMEKANLRFKFLFGDSIRVYSKNK